MRRPRLLVVDDEKNILKFVTSNLEVAGYDVVAAESGERGLEIAGHEDLDLVILDLMLPGLDGFEFCKALRRFTDTPVIVLSAKGEEADRVQALNMGADDYLIKPFGVQELLARVRAVLRRVRPGSPDFGTIVLEVGPVALDPLGHQVTVRGEPTRFTPTEFHLLHLLLRHAGKVVPHRMLLSEVWGPEYRTETEYLRVYVGRLRHKIELDPSQPQHLLTEPAIGYLFKP